MSSKTKTVLKVISIVIVAAVLLLQFGLLNAAFLAPYKFWLVIAAYFLLLLSL